MMPRCAATTTSALRMASIATDGCGLAHLKDARFTPFGGASDITSDFVMAVHQDRTGAV